MRERCRPLWRAGVFSLMVLSLSVLGQVAAAQQVMPPSRLAEMKNVRWTAISAQQKAALRVQPTLTEAKATLKLTVPGYEIAPIRQQEVDFHRVDVPGAGITPTVGQPELPVVRRFVAIPDGATVSMAVRAGRARIVPNIRVYPVQEPVPEDGQPLSYSTVRPFAFNRAFYSRDKMYPATLVSVSGPMKLRDVTVVQVEMALMQYNGAKRTLTVYPEMEVDLAFSKPFTAKAAVQEPLAAGAKIAPGGAAVPEAPTLLAKPRALYPATFDKLIVNWDWIRGLLAHLKWDYLIITPDAFYNDIQPLAAWKRSKGLSVSVAKLSAIAAAPTATQIHDFIKKAYEDHAIEYVLLVGDTDTMPGYTYTGGGGTITDYYYELVSGSDVLPDVAVGRFSGRTGAEIASLVAKTVNYEQSPPTGAWKNRALCVSDSGYFQTTSDYNCANLVAHGFTVDKIYASLGNATAANVATAINSGRLLVSYRGHGSATGWATSGFNNANVNALTNGNLLPVIISPTCLTGMYDYAASDCYSESWAKTGTATGPRGAVARRQLLLPVGDNCFCRRRASERCGRDLTALGSLSLAGRSP